MRSTGKLSQLCCGQRNEADLANPQGCFSWSTRVLHFLHVRKEEARNWFVWEGCFLPFESSRQPHSIKTDLVTTCHSVGLKWKPRLGGHIYTQMDPSGSNRASHTFLCRELQNLEILQGPEGKESVMAASVPSSMNFLCRWSELQKSRVPEEITRQHCVCKSVRETDVWYRAVTQTDRQPCPKSLQKEGKSPCNPEVTD